jgi:Uma2 family endonuclease
MSAQATVRKLTIEEYLTDPELERFEWVDGVAVETGVGNKKHSRIHTLCVRYLDRYVGDRDDLWVANELRCRLTVGGQPRFRQPDLGVVAGNPGDGDPRYLEGAPLLAVEVRSPDNTLTQLLRKIDEYFANGCRMAWLVLPEEESVTVRTAGGVSATLVKGETLDGGDLLPGFSLAVEKLFE